MSQERVPVINDPFLPLEYGSMDLPKFSPEEALIRGLQISTRDFDRDRRWAPDLEELMTLKGSEALREIDNIAQSFAHHVVSEQLTIPESLKDRASKAATLKQSTGVVPDSAEHFVLRELCTKINRLKLDILGRWLKQAPETGLSEIAEIEYGTIGPAMVALDRLYLKLVTEVSPVTSEERIRQGMTNEGAVVRMVRGKPTEVPLHVAYPEETKVIVTAYKKLLDKLMQLQHAKRPQEMSLPNSDVRLARKIRYYAAVIRAYESSDPIVWSKADSLFTQQIVDGNDVIHVHNFETAYLKDAVVRTPEISLRAPDDSAKRVQEISMQTKARMLSAMEDPGFSDIGTMPESRRLVGSSNTAARHFLGSGMETLDLKPAGQILPNDFEPRVRGGVDSSLDVKTMEERQELINNAFIAVLGKDAFSKLYEPTIDIEAMSGGSVSAHEFGHSVGLVQDTHSRLGKALVGSFIEEWKATAGGLVLNTWIPHTQDSNAVSMADLKNELVDQIAWAARYSAMRNHDTAKPYYRHSMMFMKVAEECGVLKSTGDNQFPWAVDLDEKAVRQFYETVTAQYKELLRLYAEGTKAELEAFLGEHLKTTPFLEYMASAVEKLNPGQQMPTPADCAKLP